MRVDAVDRRLVELLREDGRASNRALAAAVDVNEATVGARLRRLEDGAIMRVVALTDIGAFGYAYVLFAKIRVSGPSVLQAGAELAALPECISVTATTGRFDVIACVLARDRRHLNDLATSVRGIRGIETVMWDLAVDVLKYESRWAQLSGDDTPAEAPVASERVDELDLALIGLLQRDARTSNRRIAAALGVSEGSIRSRIRRLQDDGMIRIQAVSDLAAFGISAHAYVGIHVEGDKSEQVAQRLAAFESMPVLVRSLGEFDLLAVVFAEDRTRLMDTILNEVVPIRGVRRTETLESAGTFKHAYTWALLI